MQVSLPSSVESVATALGPLLQIVSAAAAASVPAPTCCYPQLCQCFNLLNIINGHVLLLPVVACNAANGEAPASNSNSNPALAGQLTPGPAHGRPEVLLPLQPS